MEISPTIATFLFNNDGRQKLNVHEVWSSWPRVGGITIFCNNSASMQAVNRRGQEDTVSFTLRKSIMQCLVEHTEEWCVGRSRYVRILGILWLFALAVLFAVKGHLYGRALMHICHTMPPPGARGGLDSTDPWEHCQIWPEASGWAGNESGGVFSPSVAFPYTVGWVNRRALSCRPLAVSWVTFSQHLRQHMHALHRS